MFKPNDTISEFLPADKYIVMYDGNVFWEVEKSSLKLPCKWYVLVFALVDYVVNASMTEKEKDLFLRATWLGWLMNAFTGKLSEEDTEIFVKTNDIMQKFTIITDREFLNI